MAEELTHAEKMKRAELAIAALSKEYGEGIVFTGDSDVVEVDVISTGNFGLDLALGVGGLPRGRITEIYGPEGLGKSLLAQTLVAECQEQGGLAAYIDAEHALDPYWARRLGVKWDELFLSQPNSGEETLTVLDKLVSSGAFDLVVVDSVAAMTPRAEIEGEIGDQYVGLQARMMGQGMRIINPKISESKTAVVFINQVRDKIGPMVNGGTTTPGGRALKFFASVRIELRQIQRITNQGTGEILGNRVKATILKNKVAPPFKFLEYDIIHGEGFNNEGIILDMAVKYGLVYKSGAFYSKIEDGKKAEKTFGQGLAKASQYLRDNPDYRKQLMDRIKEEYKLRQGYFTVPEAEIEEVDEDG